MTGRRVSAAVAVVACAGAVAALGPGDASHNVDKRGGKTFLYNNGPVTSIDDPNLLFRQTYTLEASFGGAPFHTRASNAPVAPSRVGPASMPDYKTLRDQAATTLPGGWKTFAGQADDPFYLDLRVFDLLYGGNLKETGQDTLAGYNVNTIALQVPFGDVALNGDATRNPVIGVWSTTERPSVRITGSTSSGPGVDRVQVSRLGNPLVNEVVVPANLKDAFNALPPDKDASIAPVVARVKNPELPQLIQAIYGLKAPAAPRDDLVEIFLTGITTKAGGPIKADLNSQLNNADVISSRFRPSEMLRLNLSVKPTTNPNRLGVLVTRKARDRSITRASPRRSAACAASEARRAAPLPTARKARSADGDSPSAGRVGHAAEARRIPPTAGSARLSSPPSGSAETCPDRRDGSDVWARSPRFREWALTIGPRWCRRHRVGRIRESLVAAGSVCRWGSGRCGRVGLTEGVHSFAHGFDARSAAVSLNPLRLRRFLRCTEQPGGWNP
jgi:hypothetical protein